MARIFLTDNFKSIAQEDLRMMIEQVLQQLQDQLNAAPDVASLVNPTDSLPQGIRSGDVVFNLQNGELRAGVYNGIEVLYASFGSFVGAITDAQHGARSGGNLHPDATNLISGFMSGADKAKSDKFKGTIVAAGAVSLTDLPNSGDWCFYNETGLALFYLASNFAGTIKTAAMT